MNYVEILALIVAIIIILKAIFFFLMPKAWKGFVDFFINTKGISWILLIIAAILFYFILPSVNVVTFLGIWMIIALFYGSIFLMFRKPMKSLYSELMKGGLKKGWLHMLIALVLAIWVLVALF